MSYEEYWHGDVWAIQLYRKAAELKAKQKNQEMWLQGMYIYEALCDVSPVLHAFAEKGTKPIPYSSKPYELKSDVVEEEETDDEKEKREENERLQARIYMSQMVREGASWGE